MELGELTEPERRLWDAFGTGADVDLRTGDPAADDVALALDWGPERTIRAEVIIALLLGARPAEPGHVAAVRLVGALIEGTIDLSYADVRHYLRLNECSIPERAYLYGARTRQISLVGSHLADGLEASTAVIDGNLHMTGCRIDRGLALVGARVAGTVRLDRAHLANEGHLALNAARIQVDGDLSCLNGFEAHGEVNLRGAHVTGEVALSGATLQAPGRIALRASACEVGAGFLCDGVTAHGQLRIRRSRIAGSAWFSGAKLHLDDDFALYAADAEIGLDLRLDNGFTAEGGVELSDATVGRHIWLFGATLARPQDDALVARGISVRGNVHCSGGFTAAGAVRFNGATVGGYLSFEGATLSAPHGFALTLTRASARELDLRTATPPAHGLDLSHATVTVLRDEPSTWPAVLRLTGLHYEQLDQPGTAKERTRWLQRDDRRSYTPEPFEQLAALYRRIGHDDEARRVLLAKQRVRRRTLSASARVWGALQDAVVAYGYRPERALAWLTALVTLGTIIFTVHPPIPTTAGTNPPFNSLVYSLDLLLPIINFGVSRAYTSQGGYQWLAYLLTAAGWVLATTIAAGVARAVNRA